MGIAGGPMASASGASSAGTRTPATASQHLYLQFLQVSDTVEHTTTCKTPWPVGSLALAQLCAALS